MRVEALVAGNGAIAEGFFSERDEICEIPVACEVAVINNHWGCCVELVENLFHRVPRTFAMRIDADDLYIFTKCVQLAGHSQWLIFQVVVVANESDEMVTGEHIHDVRDDGSPFDFYHWFWLTIPCIKKPLSGSRHRDQNVQGFFLN